MARKKERKDETVVSEAPAYSEVAVDLITSALLPMM
jgi:hypothetical protein